MVLKLFCLEVPFPISSAIGGPLSFKYNFFIRCIKFKSFLTVEIVLDFVLPSEELKKSSRTSKS